MSEASNAALQAELLRQRMILDRFRWHAIERAIPRFGMTFREAALASTSEVAMSAHLRATWLANSHARGPRR